MKHIEDKIALLGLITSNVPFQYKDGKLSADVFLHVEEIDLENAKKEIELLLENPLASDEEKGELRDEIYFIDRIMESLEMK